MILQARDAARRFGDQHVFSGLDLDVAAGQHLLLSGANGSGKSTLLRCLAGTLALSSGSVMVDGLPAGSRRARARIGLCLRPEQAFQLRLSGHDNLLFAARLRLPRRLVGEAVDAIEDELGITHFAGERVQRYSSGMRALVACARAMIGGPSLLLLDEPTRSLDAAARRRLWTALHRRSVACVLASHRGSDRDHCDRVLELPVLR